jgi:hypothetical protein
MAKPLYDARIADVLASPGAAVVATCEGCKRAAYVPRAALEALPGVDRVIDLERRLRCQCGRSEGSVWVRWPDAVPPPR